VRASFSGEVPLLGTSETPPTLPGERLGVREEPDGSGGLLRTLLRQVKQAFLACFGAVYRARYGSAPGPTATQTASLEGWFNSLPLRGRDADLGASTLSQVETRCRGGHATNRALAASLSTG
jgi:hypothetical protein